MSQTSNTTTELTREDIVIEWEDGFHVGRVPRVGADPQSPGWEFRFRREEDAGVMREWEVRFEDDAEWVAFVRAYRKEMSRPGPRHLLDLLANLSLTSSFAVGPSLARSIGMPTLP